MPIKKQEFYEGAAIYVLARTGRLSGITYDAPFFLLNNQITVLLKYSTRTRSPWSFTFTAAEQDLLRDRASHDRTVIGLICGSDGVAAVNHEHFSLIASPRIPAIHVSCFRRHGEHYEIRGPSGSLPGKTPPSKWQRILSE